MPLPLASASKTKDLLKSGKVLTVNFRQPRVLVIHWFRL
jgi:hypothetical protein